jgi:hypothetical protein
MPDVRLPQATGTRIAEAAPPATLPEYAKLEPLFGGLEGSPIVISNNPESVNREGLLFATEDLKIADAGKFQRKLSGHDFQEGCPPGSMREFAFYMHHLNYMGDDARFYLFVEPAGAEDVKFNAWGPIVSQMDTGSLDPGKSPSYRVSQGLLRDRLSVDGGRGGSRIVFHENATVKKGEFFPVFMLRSETRNKSVDARLKIKVLEGGSLKVRVVAAAGGKEAAAAYALSKQQFAFGNIQCPCCRADGAWGTPTGVYEFERWAGTFEAIIRQAVTVRGWRFAAATGNALTKDASGKPVCRCPNQSPAGTGDNQRARGIGHYSWNNVSTFQREDPKTKQKVTISSGNRDSDAYSTAHYGGEYLLTWNVKNNSGACVNVKLSFASYPGTNHPSKVKSTATRFWDGDFSIKVGGAPEAVERVFTKAGQMTKVLTTFSLQPGKTEKITLRSFVPGLISIPGAVILTTEPCKHQSSA